MWVARSSQLRGNPSASNSKSSRLDSAVLFNFIIHSGPGIPEGFWEHRQGRGQLGRAREACEGKRKTK